MGHALTAERPTSCREKGPDVRTLALVVEDMHCGACILGVENALRAVAGVHDARANLSTRRAVVTYDRDRASVQTLLDAMSRSGYRAAEAVGSASDQEAARADDLLRRVGVAGFAAANVMLLSVSVWAGAASDMDQTVASLFHWLSALIAMPAIAYAAQPFYRSAAAALRVRRLNMDVPISLGITLATGMSLFQTMRGSHQVYFDAAIMLTFFLLIGRALDEHVRLKAKGAAENLIGLKALSADVVRSDGNVERMPARSLAVGARVQVAAGERVPVDGRIINGTTEIDESLITGETLPRRVTCGGDVHAGTINMTSPITVETTATDDSTLLAEIARLMLAAEDRKSVV